MRNNNFEDYIKGLEEEKYYKGYLWDTAIGLLDAVGVETSEYLWEVARDSIYGDTRIQEAEQQISAYYDQETWRSKDRSTEAADRIAARIVALLTDPAFYFTPEHYIDIHKKIYGGLFDYAGKVRTRDITRNEWVLRDKIVTYKDAGELLEALVYGMSLEMDYSYLNLPVDEAIKHIAQFFARLWQLHVFEEGNTIATAVFLLKYLNFLGLEIASDVFAKNAKYFRNAMVRANYSDEENGIYASLDYLEIFLRNLILMEYNPMRNEEMLIKEKEERKDDPIKDPIKATENDPIKARNDSLKLEEHTEEPPEKEIASTEQVEIDENNRLTRREQTIYNYIKNGSRMNRNEMAKKLKCSEATVKRAVVSLTKKGLIVREGSNKTGYWRVPSN